MLRIRSLPWIALALAGCVSTPPPATDTDLREVAPSQLAVLDSPAVLGLGAESRAALARSPVPMLVLPASYAGGTLIMIGPRWTALSYDGDGITITLHATGEWHDRLDEGELLEIPQPTGTVRGRAAWETVNEGIRSLAWNERDVAYALEIECARPFEDARCTEGAFLESIAAGLVDAHAAEGQ